MTPSSSAALAAHVARRAPAPVPDVVDVETGETGEIVVIEPGPSSEIVPAIEAPPPPPDYSRIPAKVVGALPYASTYMRLARTIHGTELVPAALRGRPDAVMAAMMMGYELGLGPMQSLNGVQVITGRAGLSAELMRALVQQSGHTFILKAAEDEATVRCRRREWPEGEWASFAWTMADAKRAGLVRDRSGWTKYPRAMLSARVTSEACRATFADVLAGMSYTPEELEDIALQDAPPPPPRAPRAPRPPAPPAPEALAEAEPAAPVEPVAPVEPAAPVVPAPVVAPVATKAEVDRELVKGLREVISSHPRPMQALIRAYLAQHGLGDLAKLSPQDAEEAIRIAAGWPTSVAVVLGADTPATEPAADAEAVQEALLDTDEGTPLGEELSEIDDRF